MIKGQKITLRLYRSIDEINKVLETFNYLETRALTDHTELYQPQQLWTEFEQNGLWSKDKGTLVITNSDDEIIGTISFHRTTEQELSIGYRVYSDEHRGKGYMTEALTLFSSYLFLTIPFITRLSLLTAQDNIPSRKLAEKCGYTQEGILRQAYFYRGKICNWVVYSILRDEIK